MNNPYPSQFLYHSYPSSYPASLLPTGATTISSTSVITTSSTGATTTSSTGVTSIWKDVASVHDVQPHPPGSREGVLWLRETIHKSKWRNFRILGNFRKNGNFDYFIKTLWIIHMGNIKGVAWKHFHKFNFMTKQNSRK